MTTLKVRQREGKGGYARNGRNANPDLGSAVNSQQGTAQACTGGCIPEKVGIHFRRVDADYQGNTLDYFTISCHGRRPVCLLSSEKAWQDSTDTYIESMRRHQSNTHADKRERRWLLFRCRADGQHTEPRFYNAQTLTDHSYILEKYFKS
jgi:hypothetical protein